jgi:prolyl 4-hydroxylase
MSAARLADALARAGASVRQRLERDPAVHRVPVDRAEIFVLGGFLTPDECAHLITMIDAVARPSPTYDPDNPVKYRTSYSGDVDPGDSFVRMIERRLCDLLGIDASHGETLQGQRYRPAEAKRGGQRSWTAMAYLNDMAEGGATVFTEIGVNVQPQAGALLIWNNMLPDGSPNPDVRHAAMPVTSGVKYVITKWFRTRPWG